MSPPPTSGADNLSASGTSAGGVELSLAATVPGAAGADGAGACAGGVSTGVAGGASGVPDVAAGCDAAAGPAEPSSAPPQAARMATAMRGSTTRFTAETVPGAAQPCRSPPVRFGIVQKSGRPGGVSGVAPRTVSLAAR